VSPARAGIRHLLRPKLQMARRRLRAGQTATRVLLLGSVGLVFWLMLFGIIYRMLRYFKATPGIGDILAVKLLGLILLAFLSVLLLSNLITALTSFFLARDLELLSAAPVDGVRIYGARLLETLMQSSWMVVLVLVPVLTAYGLVYRGGVAFALAALLALTAYLVLPAVTGAAVTLVLVNVFPARRARDLLALLALFGAAALIVLLRLLRPEQLARPEGFRDLVDFVAALNTPSSVWLPSEWAAEAMLAPLGIRHLNGDLFPMLLLGSTAAAFLVMGAWLHERLYGEGFSRSQEGAELRRGATRRAGLERALAGVPVTARSLVAKDVRTFFRDTTQWSQLILLVVLVVIYVYNIKVLPLWSGEQVSFFLINVVSFINLGLAGFVLAAIAARFLYPAISLEGRTLWLLRSSPLNLRSLIWSKYFVGLTPLLVLAIALTAGTNYILRVSSFVMVLSIATITLMTFAIASLALGFGVLYPRFETDNAAEISTGFGGLIFMMSAVAYLGVMIALEAMPVHDVLQARANGQPPGREEMTALVTGLGAAATLSVIVIVWPLRMAQRRLAQLEP
jgi:ABC-2 type transport system permease protein